MKKFRKFVKTLSVVFLFLIGVLIFGILMSLFFYTLFPPVSKAEFAEEKSLFEELCQNYQKDPKAGDKKLVANKYGGGMILDNCKTLTSIRKREITQKNGRTEKYMQVTIQNNDGSFSSINTVTFILDVGIWKLDMIATADPFN